MSVAGDDEVDSRIKAIDDIQNRTGNAGTLAAGNGRETAFMNDNDDGLDALGLEKRDQRIDRICFVTDVESGDCGR